MATTTASAMEPVHPDPPVVDTQAAATTQASDAVGEVTHTVVSGDTVGKLAQRYDSTISAIVAANGLNAQALIRVGEVLTIPQGQASVSATATASATAATERETASASRSATRSEAPPANTSEIGRAHV